MQLPGTVLGILTIMMILGFFISSLSGNPIEEIEFFSDTTEFENVEDLDFWDKIGVFADLILTTIATVGNSMLSITIIFADLPTGFNIIAGLFTMALSLAIVGRVIK